MIDEERVAIIADGCNVSQLEAEAIWDKSQHIAPDHYAKKIERIKQMALEQKIKKNYRASGKSLSSGK